jgi:sentrin-specific protease 1
VKVGDIPVTYSDIQLLTPGTWINDELVNAYINLLPNAEGRHFIHNSFFYITLCQMSKGAINLKKTARIYKRRKVTSILSLERIFVPINVNNVHWTAA